jgi:hypothetical protein
VEGNALKKIRNSLHQLIIVMTRNGLTLFTAYPTPQIFVRLRSKGQAHMISDERIVGESEFVDSVLPQANEGYERGYELKARAYDLYRIAKRVAEAYGPDSSIDSMLEKKICNGS